MLVALRHALPERVVDLLVRVAQLMAEHATIREIDIAPAIVSGSGCFATDVRVELDLEPPARHAVRRLV